MKRIGITGLALMAALAFAGSAASSASAQLCYKTLLEKTGNFATSSCEGTPEHGLNYVLAKLRWQVSPEHWCAEVDPGALTGVLGFSKLTECLLLENEGLGTQWVRVKAKPGPIWLTPSGALALKEQVNLATTSLGKFVLKPALSSPTVLCTGLSAATKLLGGSPGKSNTEISFNGCTADNTAGTSNFPLCDVHNLGGSGNLILVNAEDELVYTGVKAEAEKEEGPLGDLFTPEGGGTTFVTLQFTALSGGTGCPSGTPGSLAVTGNVVGEVEPLNTMAKEGMLTFPSTTIKDAFRWTGEGTVEEVKTGLKLPTGAATQTGLADLKLESGEEWGVLTS